MRIVLVTLAALLAGTGCTSQQLYGAGQGWQQTECAKLMDAGERNRCMASSKRSYEEYQREAAAAKGKG